MNTALNSHSEYAHLIFFLLADRPTVVSHTLAVYTTNQTIGIARGQIIFRSGHALHVFEQIDFTTHRIIKYFYGLDYKDETLWWYDSMPHPDVPELQSSLPHHKHIPPDIKHHRVPAHELSFTGPNLPLLITQVEALTTNIASSQSPSVDQSQPL